MFIFCIKKNRLVKIYTILDILFKKNKPSCDFFKRPQEKNTFSILLESHLKKTFREIFSTQVSDFLSGNKNTF